MKSSVIKKHRSWNQTRKGQWAQNEGVLIRYIQVIWKQTHLTCIFNTLYNQKSIYYKEWSTTVLQYNSTTTVTESSTVNNEKTIIPLKIFTFAKNTGYSLQDLIYYYAFFTPSSALKIFVDREQTWTKKVCFSCKIAEEAQKDRSSKCHIFPSSSLFYCLFA